MNGPIPLLILFDILSWFFIGVEATTGIAVIYEGGAYAYSHYGWLGIGLASPFLLGGSLIAVCMVIFLMRLVTPRLREGSHPFPMSPGARAWVIQLFIARLPQMAAFRPFFMGTFLIRYIYLRSLGAKCPFKFNTAGDAWVHDPSLIEIGEGAVISGNSIVGGHLVIGGKLRLRKTKLGARTQVHLCTTIGPGCEIEEDTTIGPINRFVANISVGKKSTFGYQCFIEMGCQIGENVVVGNRVTMEAACKIGNGAVIESDSILPKGTRVAEGGRYPVLGV
jgi:carbonic anhydrase/acetyltransferase-like protein (isoleucine patch superfamily)